MTRPFAGIARADLTAAFSFELDDVTTFWFHVPNPQTLLLSTAFLKTTYVREVPARSRQSDARPHRTYVGTLNTDVTAYGDG